MRRIMICSAFILSLLGSSAQETTDNNSPWAVGLRGGWTTTTISRYDGGRMDEGYSALGGFEAGVEGRYAFNTWFALRGGVGFMQRSHRMDRNLNYLDPVYTEHKNSYLTLR